MNASPRRYRWQDLAASAAAVRLAIGGVLVNVDDLDIKLPRAERRVLEHALEELGVALGYHREWHGRQVLVVEDFPRPTVARALSPNGRVHWSVSHAARDEVAEAVAFAARDQAIRPTTGQVVLSPTFVYPDRRKRDDDNLATGVMKAVRDALVRLNVLAADDTGYVRQEPARVEVRPGERRLLLDIEEVE